MDVAHRFAELSHARRLKVGALIVKDDRIISIGYNGTPAGWDNDCENFELMDNTAGEQLSVEEILTRWPFEGKFWVHGREINTRYRLVTKPEVLHAEMNALMKLAKSNESGDGSYMFLTHSPCLNCAKGIFQAGIKSVYYRAQYRDQDGVDFLKKCRISVNQVP